MKKITFLVSLVISCILLLWDYIGNVKLCTFNGVENYNCLDFLSFLETYIIPFLPLFLISLLTYKMKDEVFTAWIKFASWFVPLIMLVTYLQSTQSGGGGLGIGGALSSGFDLLVLSFFYFIFVVVSFVIIFKKWRATR